jgi:hypothetical protein
MYIISLLLLCILAQETTLRRKLITENILLKIKEQLRILKDDVEKLLVNFLFRPIFFIFQE